MLEHLRAQQPGWPLLDDVVVWSDVAHPPAGLADVEFWVPTFLHAGGVTAQSLAAAMPRLAVIQAQTAGVDPLLPLVPAGAQLCDARGVHGSSTSEWALAAILSVLREFPRFERARERRSGTSR